MKLNRKWILIISLIGLNSQIQAAWDEKFFDPKPSDNTLILPMPCDGSMAFRMVHTDTKKPLEDKPIILGDDTSEQGFSEHATPNYISGSFSDKAGDRYFLMGKYEVSQLQYDSVMKGIDGQCPTANMKGRLPATNISWFEAVHFTKKYTEWLLANHPDKLPKDDGSSGFVRLPTNTEWEYAARGGNQVSESEFREKIYPHTDSIQKTIWFAGSNSANGKLQLGGLLSPNPVGLHDILGNASEYVLDSFRMNKLDRYHGQSGGITIRGGSYLTPEAQISSAFRVEAPYYNNSGEAFSSKEVGFRVAVVTPIVTSNNRMQELTNEWQQLGKEAQNGDGKIVQNLNNITQSVNDEKQKAELKKLEDALRASNQSKDEQRDSAIQSNIQLGAFLCANSSDLESAYLEKKARVETLCQPGDTTYEKECPVLKEIAEESLLARDFVVRYYADNLVATATNYPYKLIENQIQPVIKKMERQKKSNLNDYVNIYWKHLTAFYKDGKVNRAEWLKNCTNIKSQ
ncbi:formylglycine-generating enzyme family protein [Taylorella equigenitalis]|uniref:formylglycine-generating enzyme family protein n=1 Tax=Taylorella equigenitalis TaxID=29575 RepID=UPI0023B0C071|nr:SUMF1/EgtB/PvdO family nonheme iron enzyme [Taylorella equigenitalis]WEE00021.1 SUMF1/EgtB/PvdO family nonheme iron enzyme [Taylorella equigenitalis]WEE01498.1 SUMF1/EgtB/PvdO family nonheme iron enzyme [Taylorella equigenitalis]WFD78035.1 SUMF1/EgtB/PvdO family nonheme iron enzyme [Taylorella equigenitalis]WFD79513.1 SUMF1/EgtB/PvdO family nonheme iron enzyme [Taylorella equigenitalis]WFD80989.1 SUMF1/EgtB/PvdO family nonheme iron enzyme [Taylorella equigenitalis]